MKILGYFHDERYKGSPIEVIRFTARIYVFDAQNRVAFLHIKGEDGFGLRNHLESPGGGVEMNESFEEAAIREIDEELGATATDLKELGVVIDRYNIINRMTFSVYFSAKLDALHNHHHRTDEEKLLISSIQWLSIPEALVRLNQADSDVDMIIHRRELAAFTALIDSLNQNIQ
jgi:8-oxo-dGTP pyrophosphatase MutT (NUDIX family)